jgi:nucleoside-diphosphate-sugar epimerase
MILVTGGLGFIGVHTAGALLDLGRSAARRPPSVPRTSSDLHRRPSLVSQQLQRERKTV